MAISDETIKMRIVEQLYWDSRVEAPRSMSRFTTAQWFWTALSRAFSREKRHSTTA